jgi:protein phosphatase-4 regulatory subunit 3
MNRRNSLFAVAIRRFTSEIFTMTSEDQTRVRVYELDSNSQWEDKGTGHVQLTYVESKQGFCIIVRSEEDGVAILSSKIRPDENYSIQQG